MSVSFCNENPNKLTQKWLVSNKFYAGYYVATGMNSFLYKKAPKSLYSRSITLCSPVWILKISEALKQQPAFNCFTAAETTISEESTDFNIFNSTSTKIFLHAKYSLVSVSIIAWLAYDINEVRENTTQNLGSCQKVISRHNIIIETANKIMNKQGKNVMLDFFLQILVIYAN